MAPIVELTATSKRPTRVHVAPVRLTYEVKTTVPKKVVKGSMTATELHKKRGGKAVAANVSTKGNVKTAVKVGKTAIGKKATQIKGKKAAAEVKGKTSAEAKGTKAKAGVKNTMTGGAKTTTAKESDKKTEDYEVEEILDMEVDDEGKRSFHVKWVGYVKKTWEPEKNLKSVKHLIDEFEEERATSA